MAATENPLDGAVVSDQALKGYDGPGRLDTDPKKIVKGINPGRIPLPKSVWGWYDKYICGKKDAEKKEKPGPFPADGGGMNYASDYFDDEKIGEVLYRMRKAEAESTGSMVVERTYPAIRREWGHAQGYETLRPDQHEIGVMYIDKDGERVSGWKMLDILNHEIEGRKYTLNGLDHETHEREIHAAGKRRTQRDRESARFLSASLN